MRVENLAEQGSTCVIGLISNPKKKKKKKKKKNIFHTFLITYSLTNAVPFVMLTAII